MSEFLVEAARNSPAIATNLKKLRQRAEAAIRDAAIADTVLDARDLRPADESFASLEPAAPAVTADLATEPRWSSSLLQGVAAPDVFAVKPLAELELLALRAAQALRRRHARLRQTTVVVFVLAAATLAGGISTAMSGDPRLAGGLALGGMLVILLVVLRWQPFKRAARSAQLAEMADAMATNLRLRMGALDEMDDVKARQLEQWKAVVDLTVGVNGG